jgi:hypothetical protein
VQVFIELKIIFKTKWLIFEETLKQVNILGYNSTKNLFNEEFEVLRLFFTKIQ